jgi:phosphate acyltransferase
MGSDSAPVSEVGGAVAALRASANRFHVVFVGNENVIRAELARADTSGLEFSVVHASEVITMHDSPVAALKQKPDSSIVVGMNLHKAGGVDAFVSAGNTGAVTAASTLILGRIPGVSRPTIGAVFPSEHGPTLVVDAGAVTDCKPHFLYEFGVMGSLYAELVLKKRNPRVGLLNIGEESSKGNEQAHEAYQLFAEKKTQLNFIGNVEGRDVLTGAADVIVCDGFTGNILLKFAESVPSYLKFQFKNYAGQAWWKKLLMGIMRQPLRTAFKDMDYQEFGGVPLLGVNGVTIIGHGGSTPRAVMNMLYRAEESVQGQINEKIREALRTVQ